MPERPRLFDDLAGVAGGAISALTGLRDEAEAMARGRVEDVIRKLDLVKRDELDAAMDLAVNARAGQEAAESRLTDALARLEALEARVAKLETSREKGGGGPGMIA
jgi:BMFP domain-containing protein YqiC